MAINAAEPALATLDQIVARCRDASDEEFVLELKRLVDLCNGSPSLSTAISDCTADLNGKIETFLQVLREAEVSALRLRGDLIGRYGDDLPRLNAPAVTGTPPVFAAALSLEAFSRLEADSKKSGPSLDRLDEMVKILSWQISCVQQGRVEPPPDLIPLKQNLSFLEEKAEWLDRERSNHLRTAAGACWYELNKWVGKINPFPVQRTTGINLEEALDAALESLSSPPIEKIVYGERPGSSVRRATDEERKRFGEWRAAFQLRLERFREDVQYRTRTAASRSAYLRRYAARCMWFRRDELVERIRRARAAGRTDIERILADDAAAYLFDCGLFVLTEVNLRPTRMDLVADAGNDLLLVEAKIYGKDRTGLEAATQGLRQLLDYAADLTAAGLAPHNYLLLFRNGGKRVAWTSTPIEIQGTTVEILEVDVSPSLDKGRKAGPPVTCTAEELRQRVLDIGGRNRRTRLGRRGAGMPAMKKKEAGSRADDRKSRSRRKPSE